ncbi:MAG: hypothetical protein WKF35_12535 [Ferruginibacter sp.]
MSFFKRYKIVNILQGILWIIIGLGSTVLLIAAVKKNENKKCRGININISGVSNHYFIDKKDINRIIAYHTGAEPGGTSINEFQLKKIEGALQRNIWIKNAEMYFDNNGILQVSIEEREPIARIFTTGGNTFYIDSSLMILPLSEKLSARLPVFTGYSGDADILKRADKELLKDIRIISTAIQKDPFLMGMIEQVDIIAQRNFEMIPKMGNQLIVFGDASEAEEKFRKLKLFYKNIQLKTGWSRYSVINLQYKGQVVGKIRGADDVSADSLRTVQLMMMIAANTEKMAGDSLKTFIQDSDKNTADSSMIKQSIQRDETGDEPWVNEPLIKEETLPAVKKTSEIQIVKPAVVKKSIPIQKKKQPVKKPKAVMDKTINDY